MDLEYNSGVLYVRLDGKLINKNTYKMNNYLMPVLLKHKIKYLVFNLCNLKLIDRSGLDAFIKTKWAMNLNKGKVYLCDVPSSIKDDFKNLRIKTVKDELYAQILIEAYNG